MHTIKITLNLLFEFIRLPNRIEWNRNFFCPNWNALDVDEVLLGRANCSDSRVAVGRAFQFGQKTFFRFDSIRQSDKFAACTLIFK